uniref:Uncharacterized protein n=1 Tax=Brassica campestris TaxID=3711 RepID=M4F7A0_BRACM
MVRCFALHDVQSQSQHSARQRREELINTRLVDEEVDDGSDTYSGAFDQENYDEWKKAEEIFLALSIPKGRFYWTCLNTLKELVFWRKYFLDIAGSIDEDKLQLFEATTGVSRNNEDMPKQLGVDQSCESSYSQQWGTPSTAQQWGTPPNAQQWGIPPNAQQWGTLPSVSRWGTQPNAQQWGSPQPTQQ